VSTMNKGQILHRTLKPNQTNTLRETILVALWFSTLNSIWSTVMCWAEVGFNSFLKRRLKKKKFKTPSAKKSRTQLLGEPLLFFVNVLAVKPKWCAVVIFYLSAFFFFHTNKNETSIQKFLKGDVATHVLFFGTTDQPESRFCACLAKGSKFKEKSFLQNGKSVYNLSYTLQRFLPSGY
jgi:hypothetical protein